MRCHSLTATNTRSGVESGRPKASVTISVNVSTVALSGAISVGETTVRLLSVTWGPRSASNGRPRCVAVGVAAATAVQRDRFEHEHNPVRPRVGTWRTVGLIHARVVSSAVGPRVDFEVGRHPCSDTAIDRGRVCAPVIIPGCGVHGLWVAVGIDRVG